MEVDADRCGSPRLCKVLCFLGELAMLLFLASRLGLCGKSRLVLEAQHVQEAVISRWGLCPWGGGDAQLSPSSLILLHFGAGPVQMQLL